MRAPAPSPVPATCTSFLEHALSNSSILYLTVLSIIHFMTSLTFPFFTYLFSQMADEVESLVKHIQMVLDRLAKGSKLLPPSSSSLPSPQANKIPPVPTSAQESKSSRK
jgi:predicted PurR-regulated permease PerM